MYDEIYEIKHFIEKLNKQRQIEVLKIFNENNIDISENKNGSFVNLTLIPKEILDKLNIYIKYIKDQDISLQEIEFVKDDFKSAFFSSSSNTNIDNILNLNKEKNSNKNNAVERNI